MFFYFKHKTAYELRISDWSSDVCSSDLSVVASFECPIVLLELITTQKVLIHVKSVGVFHYREAVCTILSLRRSEEHTSELQSLMRISYAVFCLKKKKTRIQHQLNITLNQTSTKQYKINIKLTTS